MLVFTIPLNGQVVLQYYPQGKVFFKSGMMIEGKALEITKDSAILEINGAKNTYKLEEIQQIMAKKGKAKQMGSICAGGCLGLSLFSLLMSGGSTTDAYGNTQEIDMGQYMFGAALWAAIFYGGGYVVGMMLDDWEVVYYRT